MNGRGELTAHQRGLVYGQSHVMDLQAVPKTPNAYSRAYQTRVLRELEPKRAAANRWHRAPTALTMSVAPHDMRLADMRSHWVPSQDTDTRSYAPDEKGIPREYWRTETQLHWTDPRNEQVRQDKDTKRSYTPYELSSELFNYPRMAFVSTADPSRDLRPATQTFLSFDSAANVRTKSSLHASAVESSRQAPAPAEAQVNGYVNGYVNGHVERPAGRRVLGTLQPAEAAGSAGASGMGRSAMLAEDTFAPRHRPQARRPATVTRHLTTSDDYEDPSSAGVRRRHFEKNYSDLWGMDLPERSQMVRSRPQDHLTWSWIDSSGGAQVERDREALVPSTQLITPRVRKEEEMKSLIFYESEHNALEQDPCKEEWGCMKASWLTNASEIVRRRSARDFGRDESASQRKQAELRSDVFGEARTPARTREKPRAASPQAKPRTRTESTGTVRSHTESHISLASARPLTARDRLQNLTLHKRAEGLY